MISAGMIATVVTIGVLLAPVLAWNDGVARNAADRDQTVRLYDPPEVTRPTPANLRRRPPGHRSTRSVDAARRDPRRRPAAPPPSPAAAA